MSLQRCKRQKLLTKLETNSLERYIEDKIRTQNYLEQKIAEKKAILEQKKRKRNGKIQTALEKTK